MTHRLRKLKASLASFAEDRDWVQFHTPKDLDMAMTVEAAEVAEIFQWLTDAQSRRLNKSKVGALSDELADTYIYLLRIAEHYGIDLISAAEAKIRKSARKYPVAKARGSAKKYTDL